MARKSSNVKPSGSVPSSAPRVRIGGRLMDGQPTTSASASGGKMNPASTIKGKAMGKGGGTAC